MKILVFGVGGHARVVTDLITREGCCRIIGLVSQDGRPGELSLGYDVVASNADFAGPADRLGAQGAVIALGDNTQRKNLAALIGDRLPFVTAVHPAAVLAPDVVLGEGTVVMAGAVINPGTVIGRHCIINTSSSVDHDCRIGDFTHIGPGVHVAGHVIIGQECFLGIGVAVIDHLTIGDRVRIRAGSTVIRNIPATALVE